MRPEGIISRTACLLKEEPPSREHTGHWKLYSLDPPLEGHSRVVVSSVAYTWDTMQPETYIFPGELTEGGNINITDYGELQGSFRGEQNHNKALQNAGYEVKNG